MADAMTDHCDKFVRAIGIHWCTRQALNQGNGKGPRAQRGPRLESNAGLAQPLAAGLWTSNQVGEGAAVVGWEHLHQVISVSEVWCPNTCHLLSKKIIAYCYSTTASLLTQSGLMHPIQEMRLDVTLSCQWHVGEYWDVGLLVAPVSRLQNANSLSIVWQIHPYYNAAAFVKLDTVTSNDIWHGRHLQWFLSS